MSRLPHPARFALALAAVLSPLVAVLPAHAQEDRRAQMMERFKAADKDGDGALTRAEVEAGMPRLAKRFDEIDIAKTGKITPEQLGAFMQKQMPSK